MSSFAQYYIRFLYEFAPYDWEKRQEYLAAFFQADDSIEFAIGEGDKRKVFNHRVYHLHNNPRIVIMQFANSIDIPVEIAYEHTFAKDEPSCFVIIDNRDNLRSVLIQKRKQAFGNPGQVAKIISSQISDRMFKEKCYSMEILSEYYPEDLFEAWEKLQQTAMAMRFGVPEMTPDEIMPEEEAEGWLYVSNQLRHLNKDMYIVHAEGKSMEPKIHDGDLCVFEKTAGSRQGKIVLAKAKDEFDPDASRYTIKKYSSEKCADEGGRNIHTRIVLSPLNSKFQPIVLEADTAEEGKFQIYGELIHVITDDI